MSDQNIPCPSCGAEYDVTGMAAGSTFPCEQCGTAVPVTPPAPAEPRPRPVRPAAARTAPARRAPGRPPGRPPVRPSVAAARAGRGPAAPPKRRTLLMVELGLLAVGIIVVLVLNPFGKKEAPAPTPGVAPKPEAPKEPSLADIVAAKEKAAAGNADSLVEVADWCDAETRRRTEGSPDTPARARETTLLSDARARALAAALDADPGHAGARTALGYVKAEIPEDLLDEEVAGDDAALRAKQKALRGFQAALRTDRGWLPARDHKALAAAVEDLRRARTAREEMLNDPFYRRADGVGREIAAELRELFKGPPPKAPAGEDGAPPTSGPSPAPDAFTKTFLWRVHRPYVVLVEEDPSWMADAVTREKAAPLHSLCRVFYEEYKFLGLHEVDTPIPVVIFRKGDGYQEYNRRRGNDLKNAAGHYEQWSGRLFVYDGTDNSTIIHEGTHQLIAYNTRKKVESSRGNRKAHDVDSYWFQEGVAEFFAGNHRTLDPATNEWTYSIGRLQIGRLSNWRQMEGRDGVHTLDELLQTTYRDRYRWESEGREDKISLVYAQGWFLIYFLNNFVTDEKGMVLVGKPGKYREGWLRYLAAELDGRSGKDVFMECLGLKPEDVKTMQSEFTSYYEFVQRKLNSKHVKDNQLIPWHEYRNKKGKATGEERDDMLRS